MKRNYKIVEKRVDPDLWNKPIPLDPQELPVLGKSDYEARIGRLFAMPQAAEYNTIIIYGDREHFSNVHYFTDYDPRFEETLLILSRSQKPCIIVGNEGLGYVKKTPLDIDVILYQSFSLMGQPNDSSHSLCSILESRLKSAQGNVGIIGFKQYDSGKHTLPGLISDIPHYIIETIRQALPAARLKNATDLLADCEYGLKHEISAKEAVLFEAESTKISRGVLNCLRNVRPGMTELEASRLCEFDGSPLNVHPNINFGEYHVSLGLNSPTAHRRIAYGDPMGVGYGLRGSLVHKSGMYIRSAEDLPEAKRGFIAEFLKPYFENVARWYEAMTIGASAGDIYEMVDGELGLDKFGCTLNPGHLIHTDEWTNSPFFKGSMFKIHSGMAIQCDYTVTWQDPFMSAHIEDGLIVADEAMQAEIKRIAPSCMRRIEARKAFITDILGIALPDEVLPLSDLSLVCFPYMADSGVILARESKMA